MTTLNEDLQDASIDNAVDIQQYASGTVVALIRILNSADAALSSALLVALDGVDPANFTVEQFDALLAEVRRINTEAYDSVASALDAELQGLAESQSDFEYGLLVSLLPLLVRQQIPVNKVSAQDTYNRALTEPMQGNTLGNWMRNAAAARITSIANRARDGFLAGETVEQILTAIRGTKANKYSDGVLNRARKNLDSIIKTAIGHVVEIVADQFASNNAKLIKAVQWISALDSRTTHMCQIRAYKLYAPITYKPIGHKVPWLQGPGALHWGCRSTSSMIVQSSRELGVIDLTDSELAYLDGKVPSETTYSEWLAKQSEARQVQVLGKERALLYRNGNLSFGEMYSNTGQWLTLEQLRQRNRI